MHQNAIFNGEERGQRGTIGRRAEFLPDTACGQRRRSESVLQFAEDRSAGTSNLESNNYGSP